MGTLIRTAYGLGWDTVIAAETTDPWSQKCIRSCMGTILRLPIIEKAWSEVPALLHDSEFQVLLADASEEAVPYFEVDFTKPTVLVIGSEANGLSKEAENLRGAKKICIPMPRPLESLNAAVAGAIFITEAARQRKFALSTCEPLPRN
jgi:TrmH family RNA methyltransferase